MKLFGIGILAAGGALLGSACLKSEGANGEEVRTEYLAASEVGSASYAESIAQAAARHASQVAKESPKGNFMISPFSYQECLGMVRLGAKGETNDQLAAWLGADKDSSLAASEAQAFRQGLDPLMKAGIFSTANGLWVKQGDSFKPDYLASVKTSYKGEAKSFSSASQALNEVNTFVKDGTRGMIPKLLEQLDPGTAAVLVNAVSFKDKWEVPFEKERTSEEDFQTPDGVKRVPMMKGKKGFDAMEVDGFLLASGSFKAGLKITFALPPSVKVGPEACFPHLLKAAKEGIHQPATAFEIPRLKSEFTWNLKTTMMTMGVKLPFEPGADFSGMMGGGVFISEAIQKSFVEFDEEGVKAAAATAVTMTKTAAPMDGIPFIANRPFAYVIHDAKGMPFFLGVVRDPKGAAAE